MHNGQHNTFQVPWIDDCHHEACRVMTNGDRERQIFLSDLHTNNELFFLLTIDKRIFIFQRKAPRNSSIR